MKFFVIAIYLIAIAVLTIGNLYAFGKDAKHSAPIEVTDAAAVNAILAPTEHMEMLRMQLQLNQKAFNEQVEALPGYSAAKVQLDQAEAKLAKQYSDEQPEADKAIAAARRANDVPDDWQGQFSADRKKFIFSPPAKK